MLSAEERKIRAVTLSLLRYEREMSLNEQEIAKADDEIALPDHIARHRWPHDKACQVYRLGLAADNANAGHVADVLRAFLLEKHVNVVSA